MYKGYCSKRIIAGICGEYRKCDKQPLLLLTLTAKTEYSEAKETFVCFLRLKTTGSVEDEKIKTRLEKVLKKCERRKKKR